MNFEFVMTGNIMDELSRIKSEAAKSNVAFIGDTREGTITGGTVTLGLSINGIYGITGNKMSVTILNKPSIRSWGQIRTMLKTLIEK